MIADAVAAVRERIARAAARVGRDPSSITLVAIGKTHPPEALRAAHAAGITHFGENRVQEAEAKVAALADLRPHIQWHLVGHLQANKARKALAFADLIHSLDSLDLAERLSRIAGELGREVRVLVQVDLAGEATKSGLPAAELGQTLAAMRSLPHLRADGLMLLPPYEEDPERVRPLFRRLRVLAEEAHAEGCLRGVELSMGMSHDLEVAIEEGATFVRVGTDIFGAR